MGNAPLLSKAKEYFGTGQSHFDTGYKFSPFMHSVLSRNADAIDIVRADNSFKIENIEFWRAFIWTYSKDDVPCKFLEISLFNLLEMVLRKSEMTEEKQSLLNEITNDHARKRFAPILGESTFIDGLLRRVIRMMNEDKNYSLDEEQVKIFLDLHSYIRNREERHIGKTAILREQVTPISFHSDGQENGKVSSEYVKDLATHLLIQNAEKLEKQIVFLLIFTGQEWCIEALLDAADQNKDIQTLLSSKLFGSFSFLDCLLTALSKRVNRISLANVTERVLTSLENTIDEDVVMFAVREQLWDALKPIAVRTLAQQGELSFCWHHAFASAALCGNIDFVQSLLNLMSLSRLPEPAKSRFGVHLSLASLTGKTDVVRLLLRAGAPIVLDTKSEEIKILMGKHYRDNWTVLHYAVKSNVALTLETVAKFCKFDKDFMSSLQYGSLFEVLSSSVGNTVIMTFLTRMFKEKGIQPSHAEWEKYALEAAKNGFEELCSYIVETGSVDVMCVDSRHRNLLHYCALRDMDKLLGKLINNASAAANTKDLDGFTPYEYAFCLGNQNTANIFQINSALEKGFRMPGSQHVYGWLRHLLETNGKSTGSTGEDKRSMFHALTWNPAPDDNRKRCKLNTGYMDRFSWYSRYLMYRGPLLRSFDRKLSLENVIKRYDDHATAFILILSTNSLREAMIERPKEYSHLFHLTAGYGHKKSLNILCELLKQNQGVLLKYLKMETNGIIPLANAIRNKHRDCIEILMQLDSCDDWKSSRTGENVLHFACKTGQMDIVQQLLKNENRNMLFLKDSNKSTPIMASLALGHHALLSELDLTEMDLKSDCKHKPKNIDFSCETCLLNESIGWPDIYHRKFEQPWKGLRSVGMSEENQLKKCSNLDRLFNKCGLQSPIVKAVMISMGYEPTAPNVLLRLALQPPGKERMGKTMTRAAGKIMTCEEFSHIVEKLPASVFDTFSMFSWSIQHDSDALFEKLSKGLSKLPSEFEKRTGISCYEAVLGLGSYKCFNILQKLLDIEQDEFRTFREIKDHLPVHLKWLARLDVPGDEDWCKSFDNHSMSDTSERLSSADIWLISRFPSDIRNEMETIHGDRSWIPPTINGKKLSVDIESFKKHKNLSGKSLQWISCFIGSGSVTGTLHNATEQSLPKVQSANSIKVSCIQSGSNDHAKMVVDGSGCIQASIELLSDKGALFVIDDRSIHQKCVETELKDKIQHGVIPSFEKMIKANFNLDVTIKVDWQSIEIRKRNWNAEMVFKALTGEIFNNELGGFADVLGEAIEMRWDIEDMFNEETVKLAMGTALELKEITIAFDDKKPSTNGMLSQKTHILKDKCTWSFTIENNCLLYNRETFPLWRNLFFYRGMCTSLCSAVHSISVIQPQLPVESNHSSGKMKGEKTERNVNPTLEVEWKSFGLKDIYTVRSLVSNQIAREVQGISYDCAGMLRLCQESKRILVKNSPSHQHSGITFQNQTAVIAIYPSQNSKKEWQIERTNADTRLAEHEDRQLQSKWDSSHLKDIRQQIGDVEKHIEKETGLRVKIIIDEKHKGFISTAGAWVRSRSSDAKTGLLLQVHEYKKAYKAKKSNCDYTLLPWKLTHVDFKITSDTDEKVKSLPSTVTKEIGPWEVQSLVEAGKNAGFLTFKDRLYGVNDQREFAMYMSKLSSRVTIAQEVLDIFETKGNVSLESRICPIETSFNSKRAAALHMKYTLRERLLKLLPVNDINFDEESFLEDPNGLIQLSECGECAIDTIYKVFRPDTSPVCSVEIQRKNVLFHLLSKVKVLKFIQIRDTDDGTQNSNDRIVLCLQSKILSKIVLHRKRNITIVFSKFAVRETFIDEFESALIHLEEMVIEELLPCKFSNKPQSRTSSAVSSSVRRRFIDINHVARPKYETVLDLFFEICDVYKRLKETIPEISDIASHKVRNVCMSSVDGDKLRAGLVGDTLVIHVPPVCISTREFASMLLSSLGISDDMRNVEIPMFHLVSSRLFYPDKNSGEVELGFHNLVEAIDQNVNFHHTFEKDFTVRIMEKKGKINSSAEASIQNVEVTDDQHVKVFWSLNEKSLEHNCSIQVLYKMGEIDCATGLLLPNHLYSKKIRNVGEIKGDVHVDRGGWLPILLLHSNSPVGNKSEKITNPHRVQIVRKPCVEFSISAQAKSFPCPNIARNPVQIEQYHSNDSVMRYKIKILDSCRSVQLTAKCLCCEQQLSIATPDWYLEPGEKLRINPQEDSH
ncbi:hypothetical protein FSP39_000003 [Pinctada imbricata]|uniref:Uncharacterized protein n=1 Tax=Pinctada imbricata TaxID=66713 RepID=A0AA88Y3Z5_PINIB|nr:hypothetical protein FSP39_000003 [Pinctada imbricata]